MSPASDEVQMNEREPHDRVSYWDKDRSSSKHRSRMRWDGGANRQRAVTMDTISPQKGRRREHELCLDCPFPSRKSCLVKYGNSSGYGGKAWRERCAFQRMCWIVI